MPHRGILRNCRATCPARPATMSTSSRDGLLALSVMVVPFRPSSPPPLQTKLDCAIPSAEPAELHFRQRFGVDISGVAGARFDASSAKRLEDHRSTGSLLHASFRILDHECFPDPKPLRFRAQAAKIGAALAKRVCHVVNRPR